MTNMKKSTINLMEEFIHEATPELILKALIYNRTPQIKSIVDYN